MSTAVALWLRNRQRCPGWGVRPDCRPCRFRLITTVTPGGWRSVLAMRLLAIAGAIKFIWLSMRWRDEGEEQPAPKSPGARQAFRTYPPAAPIPKRRGHVSACDWRVGRYRKTVASYSAATIEELKNKLWATICELEELRNNSREELRKKEDSINQLIYLVKEANQERDETMHRLQMLLNKFPAPAPNSGELFPVAPSQAPASSPSPDPPNPTPRPRPSSTNRRFPPIYRSQTLRIPAMA
ncbi:hypothetical protein KSP40_PGU017480 [Platanthera guangdongensis]|uniref:Uncharacterized protein n=1 Tax=Platanthera guangdongensis TaxID=2320717 RepID=A0ABR2MBM3_9ASPA